ncbi:MAG TPA: imidazole glycerol phosphate synthase subunit HisH [Beutenbergiaceae bacterium]|nr:imidazole glycerol phosphate synthase subunit HisH [Beutenbergiaceae bacterium]
MTGPVQPTVAVLDYGSGNVRSAVRALERAGAQVTLTADPTRIARADGLVVPGVGAFPAVMTALARVGAPAMIQRRIDAGQAVLGICAGMQVMFTEGREHQVGTPGLGLWAGVVGRLDAPVVPHIGWSTVEAPAASTLFAGLHAERFYFVHSYAATTAPAHGLATWTTYGTTEHRTRMIAAVEDGVLSATQFHPEKSGNAGIGLLRNWLATLPAYRSEEGETH